MLKKVFAILLTVILSLTIFTSCTGASTSSGTSAEEKVSQFKTVDDFVKDKDFKKFIDETSDKYKDFFKLELTNTTNSLVFNLYLLESVSTKEAKEIVNSTIAIRNDIASNPQISKIASLVEQEGTKLTITYFDETDSLIHSEALK